MKALVECAKRALEDEGSHLTKYIKANDWHFAGTGVCCNQNERYYQFLIWRELMKSFRWRPQTEAQGRSDLAFYNNTTNKIVGVAEIKCWWTDGRTEVNWIRLDIEKLRESRNTGVMLVLTTYIKEKGYQAKEVFDDLARRIGIALEDMEIRSFDNSASAHSRERWEFSVAGFFV
ncbi:MAG TPA: hypothetical protein VGR73_06925 [Bryobacteraceae bacterium]|nr:hypothetical protein [Bryobacteraceae bacterium]